MTSRRIRCQHAAKLVPSKSEGVRGHLVEGVAVRHILLDDQRRPQAAAVGREPLQALGAAQNRQLVRPLGDCAAG